VLAGLCADAWSKMMSNFKNETLVRSWVAKSGARWLKAINLCQPIGRPSVWNYIG